VSAPFKLLLDENIGKPIGSALARVLSFHPSPPKIGFVVDMFGEGAKDLEWIPTIAKKRWVVLTNDRAKQCGGAKLPIICAENGITHILMSASIHDKKQFYKAAIILQLWDDIVKVRDAPPGSRFKMQFLRGHPSIIPGESKPKNLTPFQQPSELETKLSRKEPVDVREDLFDDPQQKK
jgi:hypothetical protein